MTAIFDRVTSNGSRRTKAAAAKDVRDRYDEATNAQRWEQLQLAVVRSYMGGDQWVQLSRQRQTVDQMPRDDDRARLTDNRIASNSRIIYSKLLKRPLVFDVVPDASDDATVGAARIAEGVASDLCHRQRWEQTLRRPGLVNMWEGGTAVLSLDWRPDGGEQLGLGEDGRPYGTGDVACVVSNVAEAFCEPGTPDIESGGWWIRAQALPPTTVQSYYRLDDKPKPDVSALLGPSARLWTNAGSGAKPVPLTLVLTLYERPHGSSEGKICTVVGDDVVSEGPWHFPFTDRLNCVAMRETFVPNRWTGESIVYHALSVQNAINASLSSTIEHLKLCGNARLIVPDTSLDLIDELTDTPGEVVPYNATAGKPEYLSPPQLPGWYVNLADRLDNRLDDLMGIHDISRGEAPANIESGVGLSILSENDDTPIGFLAGEMGNAFGRLMTLALECYAAKVATPESRKARVRTPDGVTETVQWDGASLRGQTTATVPIDAVLPRSRAALRAQAMEMVKLGLIKSIEEYELMADVSPRDRLSVASDPNQAKARRENRLLIGGQALLPADFDDHAGHIHTHNNFRSTEEYEQAGDEAKELLDEHVQAHEVLAAEDAAKKLAQEAVSPALAQSPEANEGLPLPNQELLPSGGPTPTGGGAETRSPL